MELDNRRVDHRVLNCEATAAASTAIAAVSIEQWEPETNGSDLPPSQRSADWCSWGGLNLKLHSVTFTCVLLSFCLCLAFC